MRERPSIVGIVFGVAGVVAAVAAIGVVFVGPCGETA
jgi:hypothetical protein